MGAMASQADGFLRMQLRQGLDAILEPSAYRVPFTLSASQTYPMRISVSPDQTRILVAGGSSTSNSFFTYPDSLDQTTTVRPVATYGGTIYAASASNTHYAVAGGSPYLYVFDWATHALVTVSTTGLGQVNDVCFSPDGSKLAVAHSTAPFLRVYDTTAWTYVDASTSAGNTRLNVCWSSDGTLVFAMGGANPQFTVYNAALSTRHVATNDGNRAGQGYPTIIAHPSKPKACIACAGNSTTSSIHKLWEYDYATTTFTNIIAGGTSSPVYRFVYDARKNEIFFVQIVSTKPIIRKFPVATYTEVTGTVEAGLAHLVQCMGGSNSSPFYGMATVLRSVGQITGTVRDITNTPNDREVDAYRRSDGLIMARTVSDGTTGNYTLNLPDTADYDVQFKIESGELLNDLFFARAVPAAV